MKRNEKIQSLVDLAVEYGSVEDVVTIAAMENEGIHLRMRLAKSRGEPCYGGCWFDGRCPRDPVCNN